MNDVKKWQEEFRAYIKGMLLLRDEYRAIMEYIDEVPAQPEIIRCKECKRQDTDNVFCSMWCYEMRTFVKPNEFCSRAERRDDERPDRQAGGD